MHRHCQCARPHQQRGGGRRAAHYSGERYSRGCAGPAHCLEVRQAVRRRARLLTPPSHRNYARAAQWRSGAPRVRYPCRRTRDPPVRPQRRARPFSSRTTMYDGAAPTPRVPPTAYGSRRLTRSADGVERGRRVRAEAACQFVGRSAGSSTVTGLPYLQVIPEGNLLSIFIYLLKTIRVL